MKSFLHLIIMSVLTAFTAAGSDLRLEATPGALQSLVGDDPSAIESLTVSGTIDASDIDFINYSMASLKRLDISGARIAEYSGRALTNGNTYSPAGVIPAYAFIGSGAAEIVVGSDITGIGDGAFAGSSIERIALPSGLKDIGMGAFNDCDRLTELNIPASVSSTGARLAAGCDNMTTVTFGPAEIAAGSFNGCGRLTTFSPLTSVTTSIGEGAFAGCKALVEFPFSCQLTDVGDEAFALSGLRSVDLSGCTGLASLGARTFAGCESLVSVVLPDNCGALGPAVFMGATSLKTINIPSALTEVPEFAFAGDSVLTADESLMSGWAASRVASVGTLSFYGLENVGEFTLPKSLVSVGDNAFEGWRGLRVVYASDLTDIPSTGENVWEGIDCGEVIMYVADDMVDAFKSAPQWGEFNILPISQSGICTITDSSPLYSQLTVAAAPGSLSVAAGMVMDHIAVYSITGALLAEASPRAERAVLPLAPGGRRIVAVVVTMADGSTATRKTITSD